MLGTVLADRYEILAHLGDGAVASVWRARDRELGTDVAVKVLHPHLARDPAALARARGEVLASRRVAGAVTVHDLVTTAEAVFLVEELCPGGDLRGRLAAGPLPEAEVLAIGARLARTLGAAHEVGVMHRDIKPANVLVDAAGAPRLGDFGLARVADRAGATSTSLLAGSVGYTAPEVYGGVLDDPRSDQYALAATLRELVTGRPPGDGAAPAVVMRRQLDGEIPPLDGVSPAFAAVIARALSRRPEARFPTMGAFAEAIDAAARGEAPSAVERAEACAGCGEPLVPGLSVCPHCGRAAALVRRRADGPYAVRVYARRPGFRANATGRSRGLDWLRFDQKKAIVDVATGLTGDAALTGEPLDDVLRKRIVVAADGLSRADADLVTERLRAEGLRAATVGPDAQAPLAWRIPSLLLTLAPFLAGIMAMLAPLIAFGLHGETPPAPVLMPVFVAFAAGIGLARAHRPGVVLAPPGSGAVVSAPAFPTEVGDRIRALRDVGVRDLVADVLRAVAALRLAMAGAPETARADAEDAVHDATDAALDLGARLDALAAARPLAGRRDRDAEAREEVERTRREAEAVRIRGELLRLATDLREAATALAAGQAREPADRARGAAERLRSVATALGEGESREERPDAARRAAGRVAN